MSYLEDCLTPTGSRMLVLEDASSDVIAVLADGKTLIRPEVFGDRTRTRSGVVKKAGPQARYKPGTRVLYSAHARTELGGAGSKVVILNSDDVNAYLDGDEEEGSEPGPVWEEHLRPPPGEFLARRAEKPRMRGRIWIPENSSALQTRCMEAEVVVVDEDREQRALAESIARHYHANQVDRAGAPYVEHLERVAASVSHENRPIAWLHDAIEDCAGVDGVMLRGSGVSARTVQAVICLTRIPGADYESYIDSIAGCGRPEVVEVKIADLRDHLRDEACGDLRPRYEKALARLEPLLAQQPRTAKVGDHILIRPEAVRSVQLDLRGEHILARLDEGLVMCWIDAPLENPVEFERDYTGMAEVVANLDDIDERYNEGDPTGPRG